MREELARQSFLGPGSERRFGDAHVGIVGLGGGGSHVGQQLAYVGIGQFTLIDPDRVERSNLNRLVGATSRDADEGTMKVRTMERLILAVNPAAQIRAVEQRWQGAYLLLRDVDILIGCVDSFTERAQLEAAARAFLTPYVDVGMDVHQNQHGFMISGQVALSLPGSCCLRCLGIVTEGKMEGEKYGAAGGRPQVVWPNGILASAAVGFVIQLLSPWFPRASSSALLRLDANRQTLTPDAGLEAIAGETCSHYLTLGDPLLDLKQGS